MFLQPRKQMVAQPRHHHKNAPETENDARHGGQQFDEHDQRLAQPERGKFGEINGGGDADGHGDDQRDGGRNQRAKNERQRAVLLVDRVPIAADKEMPAEFVQREPRAVCQFEADEHDQREDGQRHEQREPLEGAVAEVRPRFWRGGWQLNAWRRLGRGIWSRQHQNEIRHPTSNTSERKFQTLDVRRSMLDVRCSSF